MNMTRKRSFFIAVVCLILCVALFVGSTFAWFSDSVSNTGNRIQAGTLDIDFLMDKMQDGTYVSIADGSGDIFTEQTEGYKGDRANGINWEPGKTEIVFLAVKNAGNLGLKYNIVIDATDEGLLESATGTSSLEYALIDKAKASDLTGISTWEQIKAISGVQTGDVTSGRTVAAQGGKIIAGDSATDYFAIAVHMKETAGNDFQNKKALIDVNIIATQLAYEEDGFENSQYDALATLPSIAEPVNGYGSGTSTRSNDSQIASSITIDVKNETQELVGNVNVPDTAVNGVLDDMLGDISQQEGTTVNDTLTMMLSIETKSVTTETLSLDVSMGANASRIVDGTETKNETADITALDAPVIFDVNFEAGLKNITVTHTHTGEAPVIMEAADSYAALTDGKFFYDSQTGKLSIMTSKFSEYDITYTRENAVVNETLVKSYVSLAEALKDPDINDGNVLKLNADSDSVAVANDDIVINLNGYDVTNLTVKSNLGFNGDGVIGAVADTGAIITIDEGCHDNAVFGGSGTVEIGGGTFKALSTADGSEVTVVITGGTYYFDPSDYVDINYIAVKKGTTPETWVIEEDTTSVARIGNKRYSSLANAIADAQDGDKVELLKDISSTGAYFIRKNIDVDLGGHTVTSSNYGFIINGTVNSLKNGTIDALYDAVYVGYTTNSVLGELNVNAVSHKMYAIDNAYSYASWGYTATINNISGGSYISATEVDADNSITVRQALANGTNGTVFLISGGTFKGTGGVIINNGKGVIASITGGTFCANMLYTIKGTLRTFGSSTTWKNIYSGNKPLSVTGGKWANDVQRDGAAMTLDSGYEFVKGELIEEISNKDFYVIEYKKDPINLNGQYYWYSVVPASD